jgi:ferredoxin
VYRIEIDRLLCSGVGSCVEHAPDTVQIGSDGVAAVGDTRTDDAEIIEAAASCPMGAIAVFDQFGTQLA